MKKTRTLIAALLLPIICLSSILHTNAANTETLATVTDCTSHTIQTNEIEGWPEGPQVAAESAIIMEASTGAILYEKNIHDEHYPASITKIMTTLLAIENSSLDEVVTFSREAIFGIERDSSHIGIDVDEQLSMENCLYGIMLASANEVSYAVAEHVGGDLDSFIDMMNKKAKELGCENTHFSNANGLPDETHYTTAYDMALISRAALELDTFRTVVATPRYTIPATNIQPETRYIENHHKMLRNTKYHYDGCEGGKTGYTTVALNTLVTFAKRGDMELICVTMKTQGTQVYTDTALLLDYGFNNFHMENVAEHETNFTLGDSCFFDTRSNIFGNTNSPVNLNTSGYIVLPNTAAFGDASPALEFDDTDRSEHSDSQDTDAGTAGTAGDTEAVGRLAYTYLDRYIGGTSIDMQKSDIQEFAFGKTISSDTAETAEPVPDKRNFIKINIKVILGILIAGAGIFLFLRGSSFRNSQFSLRSRKFPAKRRSKRRRRRMY